MNQLVIAALQEGGVDGDHGFESVTGHASGHCQRMLLGDGDIVVAIGEALGKFHHARAFAHSGSDAHQAIVALRHIAQPASKHRLIFRSTGLGLCNSCQRSLWLGLDLVDGVVANRVLFGGLESLTFHRADVQELRPVQVFHVLQGLE